MYSIKQIDNFKTKLSKIIFSDFPELQIYPKEYYTNVISKYFESTKTPFAYIYGDFNKLRAINDLYGKEAGDEALKNGMNKNNIFYFNSKNEIINNLKNIMTENDIVLFKASNGMRLFEIVEELKKD